MEGRHGSDRISIESRAEVRYRKVENDAVESDERREKAEVIRGHPRRYGGHEEIRQDAQGDQEVIGRPEKPERPRLIKPDDEADEQKSEKMTAVESCQGSFQPGEFRRFGRIEKPGLQDDGGDLTKEGLLDPNDVCRMNWKTESASHDVDAAPQAVEEIYEGNEDKPISDEKRQLPHERRPQHDQQENDDLGDEDVTLEDEEEDQEQSQSQGHEDEGESSGSIRGFRHKFS